MSLAEFQGGYRTFAARLALALTSIDIESAESALTPEARRDSALRRAWAASLEDLHAWMGELGVAPDRRGLSQEVSAFLEAEVRGDEALTTAPVVLGVLSLDAGGEPPGLIGRLVEEPPQGSRAIRKFALETIGLTNRPEYVQLLERVAAEPGPFAALSLRAAGLMDGGTSVLRRAIRAHPDHPHGSDIVHALARTADHAAAADIVRDLARRADVASQRIALRVMRHRGPLPDLGPAVLAAASSADLPDAAREDARQILAELNPAPLATTHDPAGSRSGQTTPSKTGGTVE